MILEPLPKTFDIFMVFSKKSAINERNAQLMNGIFNCTIGNTFSHTFSFSYPHLNVQYRRYFFYPKIHGNYESNLE